MLTNLANLALSFQQLRSFLCHSLFSNKWLQNKKTSLFQFNLCNSKSLCPVSPFKDTTLFCNMHDCTFQMLSMQQTPSILQRRKQCFYRLGFRTWSKT